MFFKMNIFVLLCFIVCFFLNKEVQCQDVKEQFEKNEIVPDIIDMAPEELIAVNFPSNFVKLGNELTPTEVKTQPEIQWEANPDTYHTFIMVDPDARSRESPNLRSVLHWQVVNIPGSNVTEGETKAEFYPSGPPKNTGLHRYVFLAYEQDKKRDFDEPKILRTNTESRVNFSVRDFVEKHGLKEPKAGNFYMAQWDESVTTERK